MSGQEHSIMEDVATSIKYIPDTWITMVREILQKMKAKMSIENIWHPMKQRKNDVSIMEKISDCKGIAKTNMEVTNMCRVYLRVIMISDIANVQGNTIPPGRLMGQWRQQSWLE